MQSITRFLACFFVFVTATCFAQSNFWQPVGPLHVQTYTHVAVEADSSVLLVGDDGVYRSTSEGKSWRQVLHSGNTILFAAMNHGPVFAATYDNLYNQSAVECSFDDGATWGAFAFPTWITGIAAPRGGTWLSMGATDVGAHIYSSSDSGQTWTNSKLYVGLHNNIFQLDSSGGVQILSDISLRSTNAGLTWDTLGMKNCVGCATIAIDGTEYAGLCGGGMMRSTDVGESWIDVGLDSTTVRSVSTTQGVVFAGCNNGAYKSTDRGTTWIATGFSDEQVIGIAASPSGRIFALIHKGDSMFLYRSTSNGNSWSDVTPVLRPFSISALTISVGGNAVTGVNGPNPWIMHSTNKGLDWTQGNTTLEGTATCFSSAPDGTLVTGTNWAGVFLCDALGENCSPTQLHGIVTMSNYAVSEVAALSDSVFLAIVNSSFSRTSDRGKTWTGDSSIMPPVSCLFHDAFGNSWAGADNGLHRSTNNGLTWQAVSIPTGSIVTITRAHRGDIIFVDQSSRIYSSRDTGKSWSMLTVPLDGSSVRNVSFDAVDKLLLGTTSGAYLSADYGATWQTLGPANLSVKSFAFDGEHFVYAATDSGVLRSLQPTPVSEMSKANPTDFVLNQNAPNPFTSTTEISFYNPVRCDVDIRIFNIVGQEVAHLSQGTFEAGSHVVTFVPSSLPAGAYVCRMQSGSTMLQLMMVLQK